MSITGATIEERKRTFLEFLERDGNDRKYIDRLNQTIADGKFRLVVNLSDLRNFDRDMTNRMMRSPREYIIALQEAAAELALNDQSAPSNAKLLKKNKINIGFEGSFGAFHVSPRGLLSAFLNCLVCVEGIVTKCSTVRPKLVRSVHYCPKTNEYTTREYRDATALDIGIEIRGREQMPTPSMYPTKDSMGNLLETEFGLCTYKDYQTVTIQEMPERARVGQLPRSVELILEHDLVDKVKPGDRVQCMGVYRALASAPNGQTNGVFRTILMCNNVSVIGKEVGAVKLTATDIEHIREIGKRNDVLDLLARSFCPSIFGHDFIKKALVLQLVGGIERNLPNGTHLRGDINILMVGDPSTAKSQLLRCVLDMAPLAISTTGRGSSGVGLTAAVTSDSETGERRLEAGAMVLADRGIVCIDEFDKMSEVDRVAIHEVMEQQTVTIAKAGIHASLNARCSVVAAANPVYGQYDRARRPQENIGLPDSLMSRFDLLFIVLDQLNPTTDRMIAEHVLQTHQYRRPGTTMEPEPLDAPLYELEDDSVAQKESRVWQRGNPSSRRNSSWSSAVSAAAARDEDFLSKDFVRKYVHYARNRVQPQLTDEATELVTNSYATMRSKQDQRNLPVTARSLETIIRLATAHAKTRLSPSIDEIDVEAAMELMNYVLYHEIGDETAGNDKRKQNNIIDAVDPTLSPDNMEISPELKRRRTTDGDVEPTDLLADSEPTSPMEQSPPNSPQMVVNRSSKWYEMVRNALASFGSEVVRIDDVFAAVNSTLPSNASTMSMEELTVVLSTLEQENRIMLMDDEIHIF